MNRNGLKLLLIEDDLVDQMAFKRLVRREQLDYDFDIAHSVAGARKLLSSEKYKIVVTDCHLGDGTAFEVFDLLKNIPFIFITGGGDEETAVKAIKAGAFHYMIKDPERNYLKVLPSTIFRALQQKESEEERKRAENELRKSEIKNRILLNSINSPVLALNEDMTVFYCNENYAHHVGSEIYKLEGKNIFSFQPDLENSEFQRAVQEVLKTGKDLKMEEKQEDRFIHSRINKTPWGILAISEDITDRIKSEEEIMKKNSELQIAYEKLDMLARTDSLTGLSNRRDILEKIEYERNRFERSKEDFVIIICDIDNFKSINDNYGHDCGDHVLIEISNIMRNYVRKQDSISRWGGEEFLLLLPKTNLKGGRNIAELIRQKIEKNNFKMNEKSISVTMTFGLSVFDRMIEIDECIKKADIALYQGKQNGKNQVVISDFEKSV